MTTNNQIRFIIYHFSNAENEKVVDLDATIKHAENLVNENLVYLLMDFTSAIRNKGYFFKLWKDGDDQ